MDSAAKASAQRRCIVVTGAASGIGRATARLFHDEGWFVGAFDRDDAGLSRLSDGLDRDRLFLRSLDVANRAAYAAVLSDFAAVTGGRIDVLFNNAGVQTHGAFADIDPHRLASVIAVNLFGVTNGIQLAIPYLRNAPNALCMTTCSASAIFGASGMAIYSASKHAVRGLTEALAVELKPAGIRVADVIPGIVDTGMLSSDDKARLPKSGLWRAVAPEEVARAVWNAYHGDRLHWYVPEELAAFDRFATMHPERLRDMRIAGALPTERDFRD